MKIRSTLAISATVFVCASAFGQVLQFEQLIRDHDLPYGAHVAFAKDGQHVYFGEEHSVYFFLRDLDSGDLELAAWYESGFDDLADIAINVRGIHLSSDARHLYISDHDGKIHLFARDVESGHLVYIDTSEFDVSQGDRHLLWLIGDGSRGFIRNSELITEYIPISRDVNSGVLTEGSADIQTLGLGVSETSGTVATSDGQFIYNFWSGGIDVYKYNPSANDFEYTSTEVSENSPILVDFSSGETPLEDEPRFGATAMVISPDDTIAFVVPSEADVVLVFDRELANGALSYSHHIESSDLEGLWISDDGTRMLTVTDSQSACVSLYEVGPNDGSLHFLDKVDLENSLPEGVTEAEVSAFRATPDMSLIYCSNGLDSIRGTLTLSESRDSIASAHLLSPLDPMPNMENVDFGIIQEDGAVLHAWSAAGFYMALTRDVSTGRLEEGEMHPFLGSAFAASPNADYFFTRESSEDSSWTIRAYTVSESSVTLILESGPYAQQLMPMDVLVGPDESYVYVFFQNFGGWSYPSDNGPVNTYGSVLVETFANSKTTGMLAQYAPLGVIRPGYSERFTIQTLGDDIHYLTNDGTIVQRDTFSNLIVDPELRVMGESPAIRIEDIVLDTDFQGGYTIAGPIDLGRIERLIGTNQFEYVQGSESRTNFTSEIRSTALSPDGTLLTISSDQGVVVCANTGHGLTNVHYLLPTIPHRRFGHVKDVIFSPSGSYAYLLGKGIMMMSVHPPVSVSGRLMGPDGEPVLGTMLFFASNGVVVKTVASDDTGEYRVSELSPDTYDVYISAPGYDASDETIVIDAKSVGNHDFYLTRSVATPEFFGTVTDKSTGRALVGASISGSLPSFFEDRAYTNAVGAYEFRPRNPSTSDFRYYVLHENHYIYSGEFVELTNPQSQPNDIELNRKPPAEGKFHGKVFANGEPMAGVLVMSEGNGDRSTITDSLGRFSFSQISLGSYEVFASAIGYERASQVVDVLEPDANPSIRLELFPPAPPELAVNPQEINFPFLGGTEVVTIEDGNGGPILWDGEFEEETDWVTVEVSKQFTQGILSLTAAANIYGVYSPRSATFVISSAGAANSPVSVIIEQGAPPLLVDLDGDMVVNSVDIQLLINLLLGLGGPGLNGDVNNDGSQNASDLQLLINTVLGL